MQDRSWAIGLTQEQFEIEFLKRNPFSDVMPYGPEWAEGSDPEYRGIEPPNWEDLGKKEPEIKLEGEALKEARTNKKRLGYPCRGCGRVFDYPIARAGHEKNCKTKIVKEKQDAS